MGASVGMSVAVSYSFFGLDIRTIMMSLRTLGMSLKKKRAKKPAVAPKPAAVKPLREN
jgi:hypothetical protein